MEIGRTVETNTDLTLRGVSQLSLPRNTLVPFMASPITGALSNRAASAAISSYSCHAQGHDKKDTLYFEIAFNFVRY